MRKVLLSLGAAYLAVFMACSPKSSPSASTPPPPPKTTYADVQALIQAKCTPCHVPSKGGRKTDLDNFANAVKLSADIIARIEKNPADRGFMPMRNPKLSEQEIAVVRKWVSDGLLEK